VDLPLVVFPNKKQQFLMENSIIVVLTNSQTKYCIVIFENRKKALGYLFLSYCVITASLMA